MEDESHPVAYDHIDAMLFAVGFIGGIVICSAFDLSPKLAVAAALAPSGIRRAIFGVPRRPAPRTGALWSLSSISGLFAVLIGAGLLWASSVSLGRMLRPPPLDPAMASIARDHTSDLLWTFLPGVAFVALGALLVWARYPRHGGAEAANSN